MQIKQLRLDDYFWLKVKYSRKYKFLLIFLILISVFAIFSVLNSNIIGDIFTPKMDTASAISSLSAKANESSIKFSPSADSNTCYWIRPDYNGQDFAITIEQSISPDQDCYGDVVNSTSIAVGKPVSIYGESSCFCGSKVVELKKLLSDEGVSIEVVKK